MARPAGLEPATLGLEGRCSIQLSYGRNTLLSILSVLVGADGFEPPTLCSQSRCATRLRHAPRTGSRRHRRARRGHDDTTGPLASQFGHTEFQAYFRFSSGVLPIPAVWYLACMKNILFSLLLLPFVAVAQDPVPAHPYIKFETSEGDIILELDGRRAPITVGNFLSLVDSGYFDGTIFHRVIADFMIQGGGYTPGLKLKEPDENIVNESGNGLLNLRGTISMARTNDPHSANAQFFINVVDNPSLNPQSDRWGYAVFGNVIQGMDIVDKIANVPTGPQGNFSRDVPQIPIIVNKASRYTFE